MSKSKTFILHVTYGLEGAGEAKVVINQKYARLLLQRGNALRNLKDADEDAYEIYYWDHSVDYYQNDAKDGGPEDMIYSQCGQLIVREEGVAWCAYEKHSEGVELRTEMVKYEDIREILKG